MQRYILISCGIECVLFWFGISLSPIKVSLFVGILLGRSALSSMMWCRTWPPNSASLPPYSFVSLRFHLTFPNNLRSSMRTVITPLRFHHMRLQTERCLGLEPLDVSSIASNISKVNVHRHNLSTHWYIDPKVVHWTYGITIAITCGREIAVPRGCYRAKAAWCFSSFGWICQHRRTHRLE